MSNFEHQSWCCYVFDYLLNIHFDFTLVLSLKE